MRGVICSSLCWRETVTSYVLTLVFTKLTRIFHLSVRVSIILDLVIPRPVEAVMFVRYSNEHSEA